MTTGKTLFYCLILCILTSFIAYRILKGEQRKIAVVDTVKLFDGYDMKKDLERMAREKLQGEGQQLDSISNELQRARASNNNTEGLERLTYVYNQFRAKLEDDYKQSNHDINEQVWKRLNPLLDEYGKNKKLHLIVGANGMGTVLYNDESLEQTAEVIKFVNKRYAEGN